MLVLTLLAVSCVSLEDEQLQSPEVRTAKACMKNLRQNVPTRPDYHIGACTNTGVWVVDYSDPKTGAKIATYDFVNHLYAGDETGGGLVSVDSLGEPLTHNFALMHKDLNAILLEHE